MDDWNKFNYPSDYMKMVELKIHAHRKALVKLQFQINAMIELISEHASDELIAELTSFLEEE
tara:strand:+ start:3859 stop:4044 length:186 start_codon:yes stop_codon:yes gene_type:complete